MSRLPTTALSGGRVASFPELAARYLDEYRQKIELAIEDLGEEELWWRPNESSNSIGNLFLHLVGNLSLWVLAGLGKGSYERDRAGEFEAREGIGRQDLLSRLSRLVSSAQEVIARLDEEDLYREVEIQGYEVDGLGALMHAVEHMSYHTGQIVWIAKELRGGGRPLEFYPQHRDE